MGHYPWVDLERRPMTSADCREHADATCPSSDCSPGNLLIGVIGSDGRVGHIRPPLTVDENFVQRASQGATPPEARLRFAGQCVEAACAQWTGAACGVIQGLLTATGEKTEEPRETGIPVCAIRPSCRWFSQEGLDACRVCPLVVRSPKANLGRPSTPNLST